MRSISREWDDENSFDFTAFLALAGKVQLHGKAFLDFAQGREELTAVAGREGRLCEELHHVGNEILWRLATEDKCASDDPSRMQVTALGIADGSGPHHCGSVHLSVRAVGTDPIFCFWFRRRIEHI